MTALEPPASRRAARRRRRRPSVGGILIGVLGELLLTAGVLVLLFLGWKLWYNDIVVGNQQGHAARELAQEWSGGGGEEVPEEPLEPVVSDEPLVEDERFALLYVPRFGDDWVRAIGEGTSLASVLNSAELGVGHYEGTQRPGEMGNFALAAHRQTHGGAFYNIDQLQVGDPIIVQTADGFYTYRYRTTEYVPPSGVGVLDPVPQAPDVEPGDHIITLTSCNPLFSTAERIIAYGVLDSFTTGAPAEIADMMGA